jgi:hypothetical protein
MKTKKEIYLKVRLTKSTIYISNKERLKKKSLFICLFVCFALILILIIIICNGVNEAVYLF